MLNSANQTSNSLRDSAAGSAIGELAQSVSVLQERLEALGAAVAPVLNPEGPAGIAEKSNHVGSPIPLVDQIMSQTMRVQRMVDRCNDLIQRMGV